jgi:hypothetical protein
LLSVGLLVGSIIGARQYFTAETQISATPAPVVTKVLGAQTSLKTFNTGVIRIDLPKDWEAFRAPDVPPAANSWHNTFKNRGVQVITAYVDTIPDQFATNRVLVVEAAGDHIQQLGGVSENCADFVEGGRSPSLGNGKAPARWNGIQFVCDNANFNRDVVGISSAGAVNGVTLTGLSGPHRVFLTFTDASASPNHTVFTDAIDSLRVQ